MGNQPESENRHDGMMAASSPGSKQTLFNPVDKGWSWVVLVSMVAMGVLLNLMSVRAIVMLGGVIAVAGKISAFFTDSIILLVVSYGGIVGGSIGGLFLPYVTQVMLDEYGLQGTFLLMAGIFAQNIVLACFFTPPTDYKPGGVAVSFVPPLAVEKGLTAGDGALLLMITGALDIVSRLVPGFIAQKKWMKPQRMLIIAFVILGTTFQFCSYFNTWPALVFMAVVYGLLGGIFMSMMQLIIIDFVGLERFPRLFRF
nr:hypothetical protein BaRGS_000457 [Batillaria attramentaria]